MARIKTYSIDTLITDNDIVIGSDANNLSQTKNYKVSDLRNYMFSGLEPEVGGNLKITTITATSEDYLTPEDYINSQDPAIEVLNYEIIFLILNGRTYIFRKNGDTFGVDGTQTTSGDFTEIDITSIINANLQDLDSVLTQGNESVDKDVKINDLWLWDNFSYDTYGVRLDGSKEVLNAYKGDGTPICIIDNNYISLKPNGFSMNIASTSITDNRIATFKDESGTIAYLSDLPEVPIQVLTDGENISITEVSPGEFQIDAIISEPLRVNNTFLLDSITNTVYFENGGAFNYDEELSPINSIKIRFNSNISSSENKLGIIYTTFENKIVSTEINTLSNATISTNSIVVDFDFGAIWNSVDGSKILSIDICLYPDIIENENGILFDGNIPLSISKYNVSW